MADNISNHRPARVVVIIQARMHSQRLPGKVMADLHGEPMLAQVVRRASAIAGAADLVVATSDSAADDAIVNLCSRQGWRCFRGSEADVLDRFYQAARQMFAEHVVRATADNPLMCPELAADAVAHHLLHASDYTCMAALPLGAAVEVISFAALERAWQQARQPHEREHVTPYLYLYESGEFRIGRPEPPSELRHPQLRLTVDTQEDLELMRAIYRRLGGTEKISLREVIRLLENEPGLRAMNEHVRQKTV